MKKFMAALLIALGAYAGAAQAADREDVEITFDRNKGSLYAIYARALRDNPRLSGKIVLNIDIARSGDVTDCRVQSSQLGAPEVERKLCERVRLMKFKPREAAITVTKPIDFFPAA
jgi:TonB family protein